MASRGKRRTGFVLGGLAIAALSLFALAAALPSRADPTPPGATNTPARLRPAASVAASGAASAAPSVPESPVPVSPDPRTLPLVIAAGGDVNLGRECGQAILRDVKYDPFRHLAPIWGDADVRFVNLESQLSDQKGETQSPRNRLIFTGPPDGGLTLAQAGIHVASTANNHAWDYGRRAFFETLDNLARAGVKNVGSGRTLAAAYEPAVVEARGRRIAVFAVTQIWNAGDIETHEGRHYVAWARQNRVRAELQRARKKYDVVLLSYHGGSEYIDAPVGPTRRFLESLTKAGLVDAVLGHHPHVPQGIGWHGGKPIFYSLGNFVFAGHDWAPWTKVGLVARLTFEADGTLAASVCPVSLDGHVPKPIAPNDPSLAKVREHVILTSTAVGGSSAGEIDARGCFRVSPPEKRSAP